MSYYTSIVLRILITVILLFGMLWEGMLLLQGIIRKRKKTFGLMCAAVLLTQWYLFEIHCVAVRFYLNSKPIPEGTDWVLRIPTPVMLGLTFGTVGITAFLFQNMSLWGKNHISNHSVKAGLDAMPTGICYYYESGMLKLVNKEMLRLCRRITGKALINGEEFWQILKDESEEVSKESENATVVIGNRGRMYSFQRRSILCENKVLYEILASDITLEYQKSRELEENREKALSVNQRLKRIAQNITEVTISREILAAKVRIHDELGHVLIATAGYLRRGEGKEEELLTLWRRNIQLLKNEKEEEYPDEYEAIYQVAESAGIEILTDGALPGGEVMVLVANAISECVTNTYRHAGGNQVQIITREEATCWKFIFHNNGTPPKTQIRETGGLSHLRLTIEEAGGRMEVDSMPVFEMRLWIPKKMGASEDEI